MNRTPTPILHGERPPRPYIISLWQAAQRQNFLLKLCSLEETPLKFFSCSGGKRSIARGGEVFQIVALSLMFIWEMVLVVGCFIEWWRYFR